MHWLDKEIVVVQIDERYFALNGWDGEKYIRCWECCDREGDRFNKVLGIDTYTIEPQEDKTFKLSKNILIGTLSDDLEQMYKNLLPYSGCANTISGEILRAVEFIERSITKNVNISGAIKFLQQHINNETCLIILNELKDGDFAQFSELKKKVEQIVFNQFMQNDLEINDTDFEELNE